MNKIQSLVALLTLTGLLATSCKKKEEDPKPNEENELISTVSIHLTSPGGTMALIWVAL